jgi:hypothetical protein
MRPSTLHLLLLAAPPVAASFVILALVGASKSLWLVQGFAVCLACLIAALGKQLSRTIRNPLVPAVVAMCITLVGLAATLMFGSSGPARWILFGPVNVYVAPVLLPSFLVAFWTLASKRGRHRLIALGGAIGVPGPRATGRRHHRSHRNALNGFGDGDRFGPDCCGNGLGILAPRPFAACPVRRGSVSSCNRALVVYRDCGHRQCRCTISGALPVLVKWTHVSFCGGQLLRCSICLLSRWPDTRAVDWLRSRAAAWLWPLSGDRVLRSASGQSNQVA